MEKTSFRVCALAALLFLLAALLVWAPPAHARQGNTDDARGGNGKAESPPPDTRAVTRHEIEIDGRVYSYNATAGLTTVSLPGDDGPKGRMFHVAYQLEAAEPGERPVTFAFNGGPGSSSIWLHLGLMGPRRVVLNEDGTAPAPPARLTDNPSSWLPFTDLVFIDPVGTGFSRAQPDKTEAARKFWGVEKDIDSVAEFVRLWLTRNDRWTSPKFAAGESYGTLRAAGLADKLYDAYGARLNGLVLISPVLDYATIFYTQGHDLAYALALPTYAATAHHHGRLQGELKDVLARVEEFASRDYLRGLFKGQALGGAERKELVRRTAELTGLSEEYVERMDLRVDAGAFTTRFLRGENKVVGRMDTTVTAPNPRPDEARAWFDPSLEPLFGPFSEAINHYLREELRVKNDEAYEPLSSEVNRSWDFESALEGGQGFADTARALRQAMFDNPGLRVFWACGRYDLATPYFGAKYTVNHLFLPEGLRGNIDMAFFRGGHMMYTRPAPRERLTGEAAAFYRRSLDAGED
ncbi:S10 family peptidase [Desulfohalovibrio reitneri]|uniref:S10 family peptidase n=1 Tax=Desulfohalovibrio reitneri TaxID=1307759 RepID=UPI00068EC7DA|nr:hypothetical protein [Desulfohalovibrio reitneri]